MFISKLEYGPVKRVIKQMEEKIKLHYAAEKKLYAAEKRLD